MAKSAAAVGSGGREACGVEGLGVQRAAAEDGPAGHAAGPAGAEEVRLQLTDGPAATSQDGLELVDLEGNSSLVGVERNLARVL